MDFVTLLDKIDGWVWGYFMMFLLVGTGLYLTFRLRFMQIRHWKHGWSLITGKWDNPEDKGETTHLQALSTALSATIGTGNIAGVATAVVAGGPGAVFWMWVTGVLGMCTKGVEALLSLRYREIDESGVVAGGPMYYLKYGLRLPWLGWLFALFTAIASLGIGNLVQANSVADPLSRYFGQDAGFTLGSLGHVSWAKLGVGVVMATLVALVIIGGVRRIAKVAERIVPIMAAFYFIGAVVVLILRVDAIPAAFASIFRGAFSATSVGGGVLGFTVAHAMREGISKGLFSNEAGLGSASIAHAAAKTKEPVREGLVAMLGPSIDTLLICTLTALVIITSGILGTSEADGTVLSATAFGATLGRIGRDFVSFGIMFFAFSTMVGWSYYADRSIYYMFGKRGRKAANLYHWLYVGLIPVGAVAKISVVWKLSGIFNGLMAFPNLVGLIGLSGVAAAMLRDYERRKPQMIPYKTRNDLWFWRFGR
jgi:AGCS family alanine or glycine:cation symporter